MWFLFTQHWPVNNTFGLHWSQTPSHPLDITLDYISNIYSFLTADISTGQHHCHLSCLSLAQSLPFCHRSYCMLHNPVLHLSGYFVDISSFPFPWCFCSTTWGRPHTKLLTSFLFFQFLVSFQFSIVPAIGCLQVITLSSVDWGSQPIFPVIGCQSGGLLCLQAVTYLLIRMVGLNMKAVSFLVDYVIHAAEARLNLGGGKNTQTGFDYFGESRVLPLFDDRGPPVVKPELLRHFREIFVQLDIRALCMTLLSVPCAWTGEL